MTKDNELFGHPKGLFVLFFTEMWERFSYYGMRAILVLYLVTQTTGDNPGLGWTTGEALALYGWYTMLVYVASIPGGWIADRILGQKKSVLIGGLILCLGHGILAVEEMWAFYTGLGLIIAGVGLLKPNISTMVGGLYEAGDSRRDRGFTIFYIGINIGAFLSSLIVGVIGEVYGWHYGFGLAGIGMLFGQAVYMWGQKHLTHVGNLLSETSNTEDKAKYDLPLTKIEKDRVIVLLLSFLIVIVFWGAFEQAGGLMNIYTLEKTNRVIAGMTIPASIFQSLNAAFIIILGTTVAGYWVKRASKNKEASSLFKMAVGTMIMGVGFLFMTGASAQFEANGSSAMYWLVFAYLFHTIGELCASPVALSFITKLSPVKYGSIMMGVYFAMTGFGNKLAGLLGESASDLGEYVIFTGIAIFCVAFGLLILTLLKKLKAMTHGAEDHEVEMH
jgi:POT family proton-dependent oligopeptide transporter